MIRLSRRFPWLKTDKPHASPDSAIGEKPLREFVYLDEVSLASLLASQKGELTENVTSNSSEAILSEAAGRLSGGNALTHKAEIESRFQSTNSVGLQTVRRANAQSHFVELHRLNKLRQLRPVENAKSASSIEELLDDGPERGVHKAKALSRGDLAEFRVKLSASFIFQISAVVEEFSGMFDESPLLFAEHVNFSDLFQAKNVNKVITKLLAGLVPIEGQITGYSLIEIGSDEYIVDDRIIEGLDVKRSPINIAGVTDHSSYWKDIRRVLFSDNEFTILCRLAKSGVQDHWNPIKSADVFKQFAPDMAKQIEIATRTAINNPPQKNSKTNEDIVPAFSALLVEYKNKLIYHSGENEHDVDSKDFIATISSLSPTFSTAEGQREAFRIVRNMVENRLNADIDPENDLQIRNELRSHYGFGFFDLVREPDQSASNSQELVLAVEAQSPKLLDVEVVAIYW